MIYYMISVIEFHNMQICLPPVLQHITYNTINNTINVYNRIKELHSHICIISPEAPEYECNMSNWSVITRNKLI